MKIFAIESSCDESAIAVLGGDERKFLIESIDSQIPVHRHYGGVVPELAVRGHLAALPRLIDQWQKSELFSVPDLIAVTYGPGLAGGLAMGLGAARALSIYYNRPLVGINHLRGHAFSPFIPPWESNQKICDFFPHLGLLVSGGNTLLFTIGAGGDMDVHCRTVDDAAGEALDKGAKLLGLPYPGGVRMEKLAESGDSHAFDFPCAFRGDNSKLSFSGLKTSLLYRLRKMTIEEIDHRKNDLCASYLHAVCRPLCEKVKNHIKTFRPRSVGISGGVSQNRKLRREIECVCASFSCPLLCAHPRHCGDNASMIAFAAYVDRIHGEETPRSFHPKLTL
ncbi:MAG: tRNA (adenosine(37)-N6)-threonylcarbamoyltransferase complex transferase subunit TsaD [Puniceicoccales bacterium]|jgi:N6-L-threonylcarbamoyladenine synthase|nr:tRNA (adenosine(37)-N6)-threonylcarbamoyltransferase complex transferase subunit TsaD [Puniceicoccales bacterium]